LTGKQSSSYGFGTSVRTATGPNSCNAATAFSAQLKLRH
jgi:hypothetical protein